MLFGKGFCKSKQKRTSEKEKLCIWYFVSKALKRTVLTEKGPILVTKTLINLIRTTRIRQGSGISSRRKDGFKSLSQKDRLCLKKSLIKIMGFDFVEKQ